MLSVRGGRVSFSSIWNLLYSHLKKKPFHKKKIGFENIYFRNRE